MKKILVTGGTGFIGSALVHKLIKENNFVRVLDNNSRGKSVRLQDIEKKIDFIESDIRHAATVIRSCKNIDCIIHLAYINGTKYFYSKPDLVLDVAVRGIINILDGCREYKVPEFILVSSSEVYQSSEKIPTDETVPLSIPNPLNPRYSYAGGKIISELMTIHNRSPHLKKRVIIRPHNVYGPDMGNEHVIPQSIFKMKKNILFPIQGTGNETRSFIYIDDCINAFLKIIKKAKDKEIYNVGTMKEITIKKLITMIGKIYGKKIRIIPGALVQGSPLRRCPDTKKINQLGFTAKVSLEKGLKKTIDWYNNNSDGT